MYFCNVSSDQSQDFLRQAVYNNDQTEQWSDETLQKYICVSVQQGFWIE